MELRLQMSSARIALNRTLSSVREMKLPRDVLTRSPWFSNLRNSGLGLIRGPLCVIQRLAAFTVLAKIAQANSHDR